MMGDRSGEMGSASLPDAIPRCHRSAPTAVARSESHAESIHAFPGLSSSISFSASSQSSISLPGANPRASAR